MMKTTTAWYCVACKRGQLVKNEMTSEKAKCIRCGNHVDRMWEAE